MNLSNRKLQLINIMLTIVVIIIALLTFITTRQQTFYTEKATRSDRIQQDLFVRDSKEFCKNNPEKIYSRLFVGENSKELTCLEVNNIDKNKNNLVYYIIIFLLIILLFFIIEKYFVFPKNNNLILGQAKRKQENKDKILEHFKNNEKITNNDVEKICDVSNATAERYLNELEKEQKIKQIGTVGHAVYYRLM